MVPIFRELKPYLEEAFELAAEGTDKVFRDVDAETNQRTETHRILKRCGYQDGLPRFYQNCRNNRQTELEAEFPLHVVCRWLGNSEATAKKHYLKVRQSHFDQATTEAGEALHRAVHQTVQKVPADGCKVVKAPARENEKTPGIVDSPRFGEGSYYTREDSNLQPPVPKTGALSS